MARRSSSSMEVLLGLLAIESMSGYDLGLNIRASVGHIWNESSGQIYPNLKKLAAGSFVTSKTERQKGKPDRHVYSITQKGRERLAQWLAVEPQPEIPRNELLLKVATASIPAATFNTDGGASHSTAVPHSSRLYRDEWDRWPPEPRSSGSWDYPIDFHARMHSKKITITNALSMGYAAIPCRTSALSKKAANSLQPKPSISSTLSNRNI